MLSIIVSAQRDHPTRAIYSSTYARKTKFPAIGFAEECHYEQPQSPHQRPMSTGFGERYRREREFNGFNSIPMKDSTNRALWYAADLRNEKNRGRGLLETVVVMSRCSG